MLPRGDLLHGDAQRDRELDLGQPGLLADVEDGFRGERLRLLVFVFRDRNLFIGLTQADLQLRFAPVQHDGNLFDLDADLGIEFIFSTDEQRDVLRKDFLVVTMMASATRSFRA